MSELFDHPENMTVISNIQQMQNIIGKPVSPIECLENLSYEWLHQMQNIIGKPVSPIECLENLSYEWLHQMQNNMIPRYNEAITP
jgi:hypothetical protein